MTPDLKKYLKLYYSRVFETFKCTYSLYFLRTNNASLPSSLQTKCPSSLFVQHLGKGPSVCSFSKVYKIYISSTTVKTAERIISLRRKLDLGQVGYDCMPAKLIIMVQVNLFIKVFLQWVYCYSFS